MIFAPGTPQSVIKAAEQAQKNKPKVDKTLPIQPTKVPPPEVRPTVSGGPTVNPMRNPARLPVPTTPPPPVKPTPRVITDPVRPTPTTGQPTTIGATNIITKANPNSNFQGDTRVPNLNTIGAPMPAGGGGAPAPGTTGMNSAPLPPGATYKKGGNVKRMASGNIKSVTKMASGNMKSVTKMASGGSVSKASSRGDGIAQRGKTRGRMV